MSKESKVDLDAEYERAKNCVKDLVDNTSAMDFANAIGVGRSPQGKPELFLYFTTEEKKNGCEVTSTHAGFKVNKIVCGEITPL